MKRFIFPEDPMMDAVSMIAIGIFMVAFLFGFGVGVGVAILF